MIPRYVYPNGTVEVEIHCGCCGLFFIVVQGGSCFCLRCRDGEHHDCKVPDIMGIKK